MSSLPTPKPGILDIAAYVGGKSSTPNMSALGRVIKLSSNESPFPPSEKAVAAYRAAESKLQRYPDGASAALREAIAKVHGLETGRIVCGNGSDELIGLLCHGYAGAGDEVLMARHGFLMHKIYAQAAGATVVMAEEKNLTASVDTLLAAVTKRTKIVFLTNPNNPTGTYVSAAELTRLHRGLPSNVLLVIDGAYAEYVTGADYSTGLDLALSAPNAIMLRTFSKVHALPALRIGWGYMAADIAGVLNRIRGPFNVSTPSIMAGAAAMLDEEYVRRAVAHNSKWRPWLEAQWAAPGFNVTPGAANFFLVECGEGKRSASAISAGLMERGIIVREVPAYGLPNHLRITVGLEEENEALVAALKELA